MEIIVMKCINLLGLSFLLIASGSIFAMNLHTDSDEDSFQGVPEPEPEPSEDDYSEMEKGSHSLGFFKSVKKMTKGIGLNGATGAAAGVVLGSAAVFTAYKLSDTFRKQIDEAFASGKKKLKTITKKIETDKPLTIAAIAGGSLLTCGLVGYQLGLFGTTKK